MIYAVLDAANRHDVQAIDANEDTSRFERLVK